VFSDSHIGVVDAASGTHTLLHLPVNDYDRSINSAEHQHG
jgi:hypothetical protein